MEVKTLNLSNLQSNSFELGEKAVQINTSELFNGSSNIYLNEFSLYLARFNFIPNFIQDRDIDCRKANKWFAEKFKNEVNDLYYDKRYFRKTKKMEFDDVFYFLYEDLMVNFDISLSKVRFLFRKTEVSKVESLLKDIQKFKKRKTYIKPKISLVVNLDSMISTSEFLISKPKLNIEDNYNDDFKDIHQTIMKRLSKKNDKGLILLHGKPGTGKTSYIRYLISVVKKKVIFLPPNMADSITNPNLISLLIDNPNSVFVIEDAENIVMDRNKDGHSPVSALLNISDGLLSDCLNIQIICSFNTDISKIDSALMRKGRLIAKYEFKELEVDKAQALSNKLGFTANIQSPMTLTDIYNQEEKDFQQGKKSNRIGF